MQPFHFNFRPILPIDRSLVPCLDRLKISWNNYRNSLVWNDRLETPTQLFTCDVFFELKYFSLEAVDLNDQVVRELLSMLAPNCSYSLDIQRYRVSGSIEFGQSSSSIVLNTLRQLKGPKPMEVVLEPYLNQHHVFAYTLPRKCRQIDAKSYFSRGIVSA
jgi:hypothetical protein